MQPRLFEEWIKKRHQQDANLCGAYARPTDESSLVRGGEGNNQGSLPRRVGVGALRVLLEWVEWMWRVALSLATVVTSPGGRAVTVTGSL